MQFPFNDFESEDAFYTLWESIAIARPVEYSLFTFGDSVLPYYLICSPEDSEPLVTVRSGEITIARAVIITPNSAKPDFRNFFENDDGDPMIDFLLSRSAAFSNLQLTNKSGSEEIISDNVEEVLAKLNHQLDDQEEDHTAILIAPQPLAGLALLKYAASRVIQSAPDNIQELRERGFLM